MLAAEAELWIFEDIDDIIFKLKVLIDYKGSFHIVVMPHFVYFAGEPIIAYGITL